MREVYTLPSGGLVVASLSKANTFYLYREWATNKEVELSVLVNCQSNRVIRCPVRLQDNTKRELNELILNHITF